MSERHGTTLILKRHEDFEKVATYVKQQVREKSLELRGEDLSEVNTDLVGLIIDEEKNEITWHDYGHHGEHLDFNPIAESVIKEFPEVEMERQGWWGQAVWNYIIADGKWQGYTLWQFVAYTEGKGEEVLLDYKEAEDERTEEEKREERNKMCKEMAEQQSRQQPNVEIAVYAYAYFEPYLIIEEFYRAKNGRASHEYVDGGIKRIFPYSVEFDWIENIGQVLLHPMECAAEIIKRARKDEPYIPLCATEMMLYGNTIEYFSLIEPSDKKWLMELAEERDDDACAIYCLLFGMHHKYRYWNETFVDEDTKEEVTVLRYELIDGSFFEKKEEDEERLIQKALAPIMIVHRPVEELKKLCYEIHDNSKLLLERIRKGDEAAAEDIDDVATLQELCDKGNRYAAYELYYKHRWGDEANGIFINTQQARHYYDLAGDVPYKGEWDESDDPGKEDPSEYEYTLTGDPRVIAHIHIMIDAFCQRFGTPGNELGMFVPQRILMKQLVGADTEYYRGNILTVEQPAKDRLVITTEADRGEPLLYALRHAFNNLNVEMKEIEW